MDLKQTVEKSIQKIVLRGKIENSVLKIEFKYIFEKIMFEKLICKTELSILLGSFLNHNLSDWLFKFFCFKTVICINSMEQIYAIIRVFIFFQS